MHSCFQSVFHSINFEQSKSIVWGVKEYSLRRRYWDRYIPSSQKKKTLHEHPFTAQMFTGVHTFTTAHMFTGGRGLVFAGVRLYLYNKQPSKKYFTHGPLRGTARQPVVGLEGLTDPLRQPSCDCPTLRLPFLKVALPLVSPAVWLLPCIYSYEVEAVWCGFLKVGFDCIMGANNVKREIRTISRKSGHIQINVYISCWQFVISNANVVAWTIKNS